MENVILTIGIMTVLMMWFLYSMTHQISSKLDEIIQLLKEKK